MELGESNMKGIYSRTFTVQDDKLNKAMEICKGLAEVRKVHFPESQSYFSSRPFESQAAAIISNQSEKIPSYESLLKKYKSFIDKNKNTKLNRPTNWGGIEIIINQIEFWQGRRNRLHNRIQCVFDNDSWEYKILSP